MDFDEWLTYLQAEWFGQGRVRVVVVSIAAFLESKLHAIGMLCQLFVHFFRAKRALLFL